MYSNVNGFIIIQDDDRNPDVSFTNHRARKPSSLGGVDCVAPMRTPIYAPDDCTTRNIPDNGSGGNTVEMYFADGWRDQMMHLDEFVPEGAKRKGELIGWSGNSVAPGYDWVPPHVHWHRIWSWYTDAYGPTNRYNPFHYFITEPTTEQEDEMDSFIITTGSAAAKFLYSPSKRAKRSISALEWSVMRKGQTAGVELVVVTVTQDELNSIPGK